MFKIIDVDNDEVVDVDSVIMGVLDEVGGYLGGVDEWKCFNEVYWCEVDGVSVDVELRVDDPYVLVWWEVYGEGSKTMITLKPHQECHPHAFQGRVEYVFYLSDPRCFDKLRGVLEDRGV